MNLGAVLIGTACLIGFLLLIAVEPISALIYLLVGFACFRSVEKG